MAALAPTPPSRIIRVYCPTHKVGFSAPASSVVQCSSQQHSLSTKFVEDGFWEYCCDCQHYWPLDSAKGNVAADECPACERELVRCFVCEECHVVSVESDSPGRRKAFSISEGIPNPTCPGCLNKPRATKVQHECADFGRTFITTRAICPFCGDALDPQPQFPCSIRTIRNNIRRELTTLQFDPQSNLLTSSPTGPFLLLECGSSTRLPAVVPNNPRLSSKQDYYDLYYELFNCDNPAAGEVVILSPAAVEKADNGWLLREPGSIEIKVDQGASSEPQRSFCGKCGTQSGPGHTFCKRCGSPLKPLQLVAPDPPEHAVEPLLNPLVETSDSIPVTTPTAGLTYPWKAFVGAVAGLSILGIIIAVIVSSSTGNTVEKKLDKAIVDGNLFGPGSENAQALYLELKNSGASEQKLRPYRERILPILTRHPLQMITDFMVPGSDEVPLNEWQDAARSLSWATELKPDDGSLRARSLYADGRIAYMSKNENLAISIWTRAAEADPTWPLPTNGIGLIYTGRRNYELARQYYQASIQRDPNWAYPYNNMGTAYFMEKNYHQAKRFYQKAAELAPRWARPHSWLGDIAMKEGDYNTAITEFTLTLDANATGTKNMNLDKIREQLILAQQKAASSSF
jgi:tetratricopeptide (TPR) repeat protein